MNRNNKHQADLRERRKSLGLKRKEFWLTEEENIKLKEYLEQIRSK